METLQTASLAEQIEERLRKQIFNRELKPGERISADRISERLNVSVTPIRDAINSLANEGFVRVEPRVGVFVERCDPTMLRDIYDVRIALECLAIRKATHNASDEEIQEAIDLYSKAKKAYDATGDFAELIRHDHHLHALIIENSGNDYLKSVMSKLRNKMKWAMTAVETRTPDSFLRTYPEHIAVLEAMMEKDSENAEELLRQHLERAYSEAVEIG